MQCLLLIITLSFTCGEKKNWYIIKKSQNIVSIVVALRRSNSSCSIYKIQKETKSKHEISEGATQRFSVK